MYAFEFGAIKNYQNLKKVLTIKISCAIIINVARAQANKTVQSYFDLLAQSVEHLTFNQGVRSSSLR